MTENITLPKLDLPTRWEVLQRRADERGIDASEVVERVDKAAKHLDRLLERIQSNGLGAFEVIFGLSGSGKTTFVNTLPKFFDGVVVRNFPKESDLIEIPDFAKRHFVPNRNERMIILIGERDNPTQNDVAQAEELFSRLVDLFRQDEGQVLLLWTITKEERAREIAQKAWIAGRDSIVSPITEGIFDFHGLPKENFLAVADTTARNLRGDGLQSFGIDDAAGKALSETCETISDFLGN